MSDRFHRAARDGYLDILHDATRRDCNKEDEDGMTPTLWAAFYGKLDALRLLVGRGGDPDKCDFLGNTALHCACSNGHTNVVSFLVAFGVNMFALDNDFHMAIDIAAMNEHMEIVKFLDSAIAKAGGLNTKTVQKQKTKASLDAQKRVKIYEKLQNKAQKKAEKEDREQFRKNNTTSTTDQADSYSIKSYRGKKDEKFTLPGRNLSTISQTGPRNYSAHIDPAKRKISTGSRFSTGVVSKIQGKRQQDTVSEFHVSNMHSGKRTQRSLSGFKRDTDVLYVPKADYGSEDTTDSRSNGANQITEKPEVPMFDRPGFGNLAFFSKPGIATGLQSLSSDQANGNINNERNIERKSSVTDSIGSVNTLMQRMENIPWNMEDIENLEDDIEEASPLELFLTIHNVSDYISVLSQERMDMESLMLCSEDDLRAIGIPLGPRKKLIEACTRRRDVLKQPGPIVDDIIL
ncbi:unnamed protein product [Owenia fusiformis]|uniref:Uncharacterized protein n=1 Tax=Owenia fusiformis TaxID=6347 RepID=A0A8J1UNT3_OWEFU|nr:unnamed protein product [Owenia fusiformis]